MMDLPAVPSSVLIHSVLGLYALAFLAGGVYLLEQRVARIRDQFPKHGLLATLSGYAALGIGGLAALSVSGSLAAWGGDFRLGALVATVSGVGYWVYRAYTDTTPPGRVRDAALAFACAAVALLTAWWISTI